MKPRVFKTNMLSWHVQFTTYSPETMGFKYTFVGGFSSWDCAYRFATFRDTMPTLARGK